MTDFWNRISFEVLGSVIGAWIVSAVTALWRHVRRTGEKYKDQLSPPLLDWHEWGYFSVTISALAGCILISVGLVMRWYGLAAPAEWRLWPLLISWAIYLVLSFGVGFFGQGILSAYKGLGRVVTVHNDRRRQAIFMGSVWAKLAALLLFLGWALMTASQSLAQPLSWSFVAFLGIDAVIFIALLLSD